MLIPIQGAFSVKRNWFIQYLFSYNCPFTNQEHLFTLGRITLTHLY